MHDHRNMVIHVLTDAAQETSRQNRNTTKRDTDVVHPLVTLSIRQLARSHNGIVRGLATRDSRNGLQFFQQRRAGEFDGFADVGRIGDVELRDHHAANEVFRVGDELGNEDVVVDRVADAAPDDADGERERRDCRDEILEHKPVSLPRK